MIYAQVDASQGIKNENNKKLISFGHRAHNNNISLRHVTCRGYNRNKLRPVEGCNFPKDWGFRMSASPRTPTAGHACFRDGNRRVHMLYNFQNAWRIGVLYMLQMSARRCAHRLESALSPTGQDQPVRINRSGGVRVDTPNARNVAIYRKVGFLFFLGWAGKNNY